MDEIKLYDDGIEEANKFYAVMENVLFLVQFIIAYFGMRYFRLYGFPVISIAYILFAIIMLGFVLRKHLCTGCYYYGKRCHCGWGKVSSAMYKKGSGNIELGGKLAVMTWSILSILPVLVMVLAVVLKKISFSCQLWFFIPYIIVVAVTTVLHVKDCKECKMRFVCPGSAAKDENSAR